MATDTEKMSCVTCNKITATLRCGGCLQEFCLQDLQSHLQELEKQLDKIEVNRNRFQVKLTEQLKSPKTDALIKQIDEWERASIKKIQQTAEETRQMLRKNIFLHSQQIDIDLKKLSDQLQESREQRNFNEISLQQFQEELEKLTNNLIKLSNISAREASTPFIGKICFDFSGKYLSMILIE